MKILNIKFNNITRSICLKTIRNLLLVGGKYNIFFLNIDCLRIAQIDEEYKIVLDNADLLLADGIALRLICRLYGESLQEDLNGTDLIPHIIKMAAESGFSVFFLGGKAGIATRAATNSKRRHPNLKIAGSCSGYFPNEETIIKQINSSKADILLVAFGVPRQEKWICKHRNQLNAKLFLGVGAFLDYLSDSIPRAPLWMRKLHLEWLWRIYINPQRMFKRYIVDGIPFICKIFLFKMISNIKRIPSSS